ncbi:Inner membrane protein YiaV precursor [Falsiruegeria litorea R37]|uniref:Inner membrane protein YiaV n=1 Tax=Falsiruegeria litorea R37 TaxID=1200284 RepID=A0A1Y5TBC1_9RHOB|nr:biotin/lipoyl-binding protein [Falsiruegeria litorea]SLN59958.1 Inner membrane protein YiaV precursor [Falsiruegeria litorea R37]
MIVFLTLIYVALLFVLIRLKVVPNSGLTWATTLVWMVVLFIFLFIPLQWGAPQGSTRVLTRAVQVIPNVNGEVIEITAEPNVAMKKGDLLFQLDPEPFQIALNAAEAQLVRVEAQAKQDIDALRNAEAQLRQALAAQVLAQNRYDDDAQLVQSGAISENRLEQRETDLEAAEAAVDQASAAISQAETELGAVTADGTVAKVAEAQANLDQARWNLKQTTVVAPSDGYITNLALAVGQRVTSFPIAPSMVFVDTSEKTLVVNIQQIYMRHLKPGQEVEIALKTKPGEILTGKVRLVTEIASQGQALVSGTVYSAGQIQAEPFVARIDLDDPALLTALPPGAVGTAAIYTESVKPTHIIRRVMIRMQSIMNYVIPPL